MRERFRELYWQVILRILVVSSIVVLLGAFYVMALVSFEHSQAVILLISIVLLTPFLLGVNFTVLYLNLSPVRKLTDKLKANIDVSDDDRLLAERRILVFPYYNLAYSVWWFLVGGLILAWILKWRTDLNYEDGFYIIAAATSCGVLAGMGVFYSIKSPLRKSLKFILERSGRREEKQALFVPLSVKLVFSMLMIIGLILTFMSFLSVGALKTAVTKGICQLQKNKLVTLIPAMEEKAGGDRNALISLLNMTSRPGTSLCLVNKDFVLEYCPSEKPSPQAMEKLSSSKPGEITIDKKSRWSWVWGYYKNGPDRILSGWEPVEIASIERDIKSYFLKANLVAVLIAIALAILMARDISTPIMNVSRMAMGIAKGNIETDVAVGGEDETGILSRAFNRMTGVVLTQLDDELKKSRAMVDSIRNAVLILAPMSKEMVAIAGEQSTGSIEQAAAAEEAATTSHEIFTVSKQIAENAAEATNMAGEALKLTQEGQERIKITTAQIDDINKKMKEIAMAVLELGTQSQEIGGVVRIIDEISEQTNLLALNAAIEAVGAGEHGRRFGVVAQEIRRLAQSTADSTRRIQEIVNRMQKAVSASIMRAEEGDHAVELGRKGISETASLFQDIYHASEKAAPRLKEIDMMTSQQASASEQMADTINEVRETAQQSSASAEELQASIRELEDIVEQLQSQLQKSKIA